MMRNIFRRNKRKDGLFAASIAFIVLASCAQSPEQADGTTDGSQSGAVVLQFAWWGGEARHAATQELIDLYEKNNPNVKIEGTYADFSSYWDRLNTNIAGGNMPDVMQQETRYVREYVSRDLLADLNDFVGGSIQVDDIDPSVANSGKVDGALYGIPNAVNYFGMLLSPDAFEKADVELPNDTDWSWEDWINIAAKITQNTSGEVYGAQPRPQHDAMLEIFARQRGESLFTEDGDVGTSRETLIAYWTMIENLHDSGGAPAATTALEFEAQNLEGSILATNNGASMPAWSNQLGTLEDLSGEDLQIVRFPGENSEESAGMYVKPSQFWSIARNTEHPDEAADFVDFLLNSEEAAEILLSERGLHSNLERRAQVLDSLPAGDQKAAKFLDEIATSLGESATLPPPGGGQVETIVMGIYESLLFGEISVEEAADRYLDELQSAIK